MRLHARLDTFIVRAIEDFYCVLNYKHDEAIIRKGEMTKISFTCNINQSWLLLINGVYYPFDWGALMKYFEPVGFVRDETVYTTNLEEDDLISRRKAIEAMKKIEQEDVNYYPISLIDCFDSRRAIEALNNLPAEKSVIIHESEKNQ